MGVFGLIEDFLIQQALHLELDGLFIDAVTNHVASQQLSEKSGFRSCAIMFGLLPSDAEFKEITGLAKQKISVLVRYKLLKDYSQVKIYPPARHSRQIESLYNAIGIAATVLLASPAEACQGGDELIINASHDSVLNVAQIEILNFGDTRQVLQKVHAYLRNFCIKKADVIFLHLDLSSPQTALLTEAFEKMGFFFSGILPGGKSGKETLILQYLNNLDLDYGQICLSLDDARELLAYIKQNGSDKTECDY
jgi:serine/threonine-protein kinase RsbW